MAFSPPLILSPDQWAMPGPVGPAMRVPVPLIVLHHTVTPVTADPVKDAQSVARIGIQRFGRMSYSALVHPARVIFWGQLDHIGAHTAGHNSRAVGIALVGRYDVADPPDSMVFDACVAIWAMRSYGVVTPHPMVVAHEELASTACPGSNAVRKVLPFMRAVAADPGWRP